jgi:hypothetical protein
MIELMRLNPKATDRYGFATSNEMMPTNGSDVVQITSIDERKGSERFL